MDKNSSNLYFKKVIILKLQISGSREILDGGKMLIRVEFKTLKTIGRFQTEKLQI